MAHLSCRRFISLMKKLIFIYGPTAVGKLTLASTVSSHIKGFLFHNHITVNFCKSIHDHGSEPYNKLIGDLRLLLLDSLVQEHKSVVFTMFYWGNAEEDVAFVEKVQKLAHDKGVELFFIGLEAKLDILKQRVTSVARAPYQKPNDLDALQRAISGWTFSKIEHVNSIIIDTSNLSEFEIARLAINFIEGSI